MQTFIYFHICMINNWKDVTNKLWNAIVSSGLYDKVAEIRCVLMGAHDNTEMPAFLSDPKIRIVYEPQSRYYERIILNCLYQDATQTPEDFRVLYIHSKGVTHNNLNPAVNDWVDYLTYFNIQKHEECMRELLEYDAVSVNFSEKPQPHFSGNFWWSKSSHIRNLGYCDDKSYNGPEFWITKIEGKYKSLWNSGVNHYEQRYYPIQYTSFNI